MDFNEEELQEQNTNHEPIEESASSDLENNGVNPASLAIKEATKRLLVKGFITIVTSPIFWIILGGILLFVFILIVIKFDFFGIGNINPDYYETPCDKVILVWEKESYTQKYKNDLDYKPITDPYLVTISDTERFEYKEYDYDTYIAGIVWTDNYNAGDVENQVVYEMMSIVARSRLIANMATNCIVLKEYDEQASSFTELTGDEEKYSEINDAVRSTKGMIIGKDRKIISALYSAFSYKEKVKDEYISANSKYFYHMVHENEEEQQVIPMDWVEEIEKAKGKDIPKSWLPFTLKLTAMSIYGSKYLLEQIDTQFELYRTLEYYFGRDIEYYTIYTAFSEEPNLNCSPISLHNTKLPREVFIRLAKNYGNSHGGGAKILGDNAEMIYDMASSNGINPELVFVRADVEGYSPGASRNNYWGLGCTNTGGLSACKSYNSLAEGVAGFLSFASKFSSITDFMGEYAYLGDYWYNPGDWKIGGCVYASAIYDDNIPERVKDACASGKTCTVAGGDDCVPTTEEDKYAYLVYQLQSMISSRKKIFGLDADVCTPSSGIGEPGSGNCTIYKQGDPRWGSIKLGTSSTTMSRSGCAVTSVAIAMSCSGTIINNVANFNPGMLVEKMNATGGFDGANIYWNNNAIRFFAPSFNFVKSEKFSGNAVEKLDKVQDNMSDRTSILLHFKNDAHPRGHYVVLKQIVGQNFTVYDPASGSVNSYNVNDLDQIVVYRY